MLCDFHIKIPILEIEIIQFFYYSFFRPNSWMDKLADLRGEAVEKAPSEGSKAGEQ